MDGSDLIDLLLDNRHVLPDQRIDFLQPKYSAIEKSDPFGLPDMLKAVGRLEVAYKQQESILIYGDYDSDGVTATALLVDGLASLGFKKVSYHLPNRFTEGYGMNSEVIKNLNPIPNVIITVDCGSTNVSEVDLANKRGIDVIVTDHHQIGDTVPKAIAVVNPNRPENTYPNPHLSGVGVAFSLIRALQQRLKTLPQGQEKWLLDLVTIGTVADLMPLLGENRILVKYGLIVLKKTRRLGIKYLLSLSGLTSDNPSADMVAFGLGPRFNAAGRLDNAELALNVLMAKSSAKAKEAVEQLEYLNQKRRALQDKIYQEAFKQAEENDDAVLVLSGQNWHEGVVGIVASKIMEQFSKPVFILQNKDNVIKGSARSFGDFSIAAALQSMPDIIEKGGGHAAAGGLTLKADNLLEFTKRINAFYKEQGLTNQLRFLQPKVDANLPDLHLLTLSFYRQMEQLAPFGVGNPEPIFEVQNLRVKRVQKLGRDAKHLKLNLVDEHGVVMDFLGFNLAETYTNLKEGDSVSAVFNLTLNEWQGRQSVEGRLIDLLIG